MEPTPESSENPSSPPILPAHIFREYDIRGLAGPDLNPATAEHLGRSYVVLLRQLHPHLPSSRRPRVAVGRDVRLSSPALAAALCAGIARAGAEVVDVGVCPTPLLYFSLFHLDLEGGIMVTGSHNPPDYNGLKVCVGRDTIHGPAIQRLKEIASQVLPALASAPGPIENYPIIPAYLSWMADHFREMALRAKETPIAPPRPLRLVLDAGNGTAGLVAPSLYRALGCQVIELYCEPDGHFPHHHPDPTIPENLQDLIKKVRSEKADLGLAFDGDADRLGVVDETGQIVWGDRLLYVFAQDILSSRPPTPSTPPPLFIGEVKCSQAVYDAIEASGGKVLMSRAGHSPIKQLLKDTKGVLAGELSGHLFFADRYFGYDDAIYAGARLIEILIRRQVPLSALLSGLPQTFSTPEIRIPCPEERKFQAVAEISQALQSGHHPPFPSPLRQVVTIDGLRLIFDSGWALIRASNTQPALVLRFEAASPDELNRIQEWLTHLIWGQA